MDAATAYSKLRLSYGLHAYRIHDGPIWLRPIIDSWIMLPIIMGILFSRYPEAWITIPPLAAALILATRQLIRDRSILRRRREEELPENEASASLLCIGLPEEVDSLRDLTNNFFEPVILLFSPFRSGVRAATIMLISCGGYLFLHKVLHLAISYAVMTAGVLCFLTASSFYVLPCYYRIVPGRLEILRYGWARWRAAQIAIINLRGVRIEARFDKRKVVIEPPQTDHSREVEAVDSTERRPKRYEIDLHNVTHPHRFVKYLFQGALCPSDAPPMTHAELLG